MNTNFKIRYRLLLVIILSIIIGITYYISKDTIKDKSIDINSLKEINSINDIENKEIYNGIMELITENKTDIIKDGTNGYIVICIDSTNRDIEISDCRYNSNTGNIEIIWKLSNTEESVSNSKKVKVYGIEHYGHNIKLITDTTNSNILNVIVYKVGNKNLVYDVDAMKLNDELNIDTWYGDGLYSIVLDENRTIKDYKKIKSVEVECKVLDCSNNTLNLQLENGYNIEVVNKGKLVQAGIIYTFSLYNGTNLIEAIANEIAISPV